MNSEILIYQNPDGNIKIDVRLDEDTVWLTQEQMATLFGKGRSTVTEHISNVFKEGELEQNRTCRKFRLVRQEGNREVEREIDHYNLDVIISVGYRVKSPQGTQFRIWATQRLKEYIIKGFALNDDRFKSGSSMNYFTELQESIEQYLAFAETMAQQNIPMYMTDWIQRLDTILQMNKRELLNHAGNISHEKALQKSGEDFKKFLLSQKEIEKEQSIKEIEEDIKKLSRLKSEQIS